MTVVKDGVNRCIEKIKDEFLLGGDTWINRIEIIWPDKEKEKLKL